MTRFIAFLFGALITLHSPSGRELFVNGDEIMVIRDETTVAFWSPGCRASVIIHDRELCVRETPTEVKAKVEASK